MEATTALFEFESDTDPSLQITVILPAVSRRLISVPLLEFPVLYIETPGSEGQQKAVHNLKAAPAGAFDAWINNVIEETGQSDEILEAILSEVNRCAWSTTEKWWIINVLAERGVDFSRYLFDAGEIAKRTVQTARKSKESSKQ